MPSPEQIFHHPHVAFAPDKTGGDTSGQTELQHPQQTFLSEGIRELTWGERLSKDGFWVFNYLHGIGPTRHLRELAKMEGIDFDAGLEELRGQGLLDESNPKYPEVILSKPKLTRR